jgi:hypothetical protein
MLKNITKTLTKKAGGELVRTRNTTNQNISGSKTLDYLKQDIANAQMKKKINISNLGAKLSSQLKQQPKKSSDMHMPLPTNPSNPNNNVLSSILAKNNPIPAIHPLDPNTAKDFPSRAFNNNANTTGNAANISNPPNKAVYFSNAANRKDIVPMGGNYSRNSGPSVGNNNSYNLYMSILNNKNKIPSASSKQQKLFDPTANFKNQYNLREMNHFSGSRNDGGFVARTNKKSGTLILEHRHKNYMYKKDHDSKLSKYSYGSATSATNPYAHPSYAPRINQ